jgi:hypothetical protein
MLWTWPDVLDTEIIEAALILNHLFSILIITLQHLIEVTS